MASKGFMDETKRVFKGTCPNPARYWKFLDASEDADNIYFFCMKIFEALISSSKDQFLDDDHEAMYSTLMILEFYKNTKLKSEKWLQETEKLFEDNKPKLFEHARWIIKLYIKNAQDNQFAINFISSICHIPEKFTWQVEPGQQIQQALREASEYSDIIELKRRDKPYKKLAQFSFDEIIKESKINAFSYCCFIDYLRSTNYQPKKKIWLHVLDTLKGLIHAQRFTAKSYELVTIFLHFISVLIRFHGCAYDDLLKEMIYLVNLLRNSPGHNAYLAQQLFEIMHNQLKSPGYSLRREIKRRFVNIDLKKAENLGSRKYYLTYRKITFSNPEYCSINNLRKLIIYNILGSFKIDNINKLWATVQPLDSDTTFDLYYKIMNIIDITFNLETYESIHKLTRQSIAELFKSPWKPYRKLKSEEQSQLTELIVPEHPQRFFQFPNFEIINVKPQSLIAENNEHAINELFEQVSQYPYHQFFYSSFLQFVFLGSDEELSRILQMICPYLIEVQPNTYQKLAFYLVPSREGQCYLAEYLSTKDIWYRRHVYNVFRDRLLFPNISLQDPEIKDSFPSYLYTKSFHMYLREAQRKVPIQIFQCELLIEDGNGKSQSKIIYFLNHVLIGSSMQSALTKIQTKRQKKNAYVDLLEVYLEKIKKLYPIALDITVRYKQPGTDSLITKEEKYLAIEDMQICNTPKQYFFGYKPNPLTEFIQLSILTQNASKVFKTQIETRQNFKRHEDPEIFQSFRDLYINMTAESIVVERSDGMKDMLKMLIDGVQIHDVQKFKITPAFTEKKLPLTFPIRCFLPFQA